MPRRPPRDPVERHELRLRRLFHSILLAAASPALVACSETPKAAGAPDAAASDATQGTDASLGSASDADDADPGDAGSDVDCSSIVKLGCAPLLYPDGAYVDQVLDAEICPLFLPCGMPANTIVGPGCDIEDEGGNSIGCHIADGGECQKGAYVPAACGQVDLECRCDLFVGGGRGSVRTRRARSAGRAHGAVGAYFARMAAEEEASVGAFHRLRDELAAHGAPARLVARAGRCARDEVRHARAMKRLAHRCGGTPARTTSSVAPGRARELEAIARENAVEGCVRETFGALLAAWQAHHARGEATRRFFAGIAADETRHAALAWAVAEWAESRLDARARSRVRRAHQRALGTLRREIERRVSPALVGAVGLPAPAHARALLGALERRLAA